MTRPHAALCRQARLVQAGHHPDRPVNSRRAPDRKVASSMAQSGSSSVAGPPLLVKPGSPNRGNDILHLAYELLLGEGSGVLYDPICLEMLSLESIERL